MKTLKQIKDGLELAHKTALRDGLVSANMNVSKMAKGLDISRGTAYKYLRQYFGNDFLHTILEEIQKTANTQEDVTRLLRK